MPVHVRVSGGLLLKFFKPVLFGLVLLGGLGWKLVTGWRERRRSAARA